MLKRIPILLALLALGACCCGPVTGSEPRPVHAVKLGGWYYLLLENRPAGEGAPALGPEYARVLRKIGCEGVIHTGSGHIQDACGFQEGDSDLLPGGTTLHPVGDAPGGQRLGAVTDGRLLILGVYFPAD